MDAKGQESGGSGGRPDRHGELGRESAVIGVGSALARAFRSARQRADPHRTAWIVVSNRVPSGRRKNSLTPGGGRPDRDSNGMAVGTTAATLGSYIRVRTTRRSSLRIAGHAG